MSKSKFNEDKRKEELFAKWLDDNFYNKYIDDYDKIERNTDEILQKKGVDVIVVKKNGQIEFVDEKATLHYINKDIKTFAFEVLNVNSGKKGWIFNEDYKTTYYLLAWPNATDDSIPNSDAFSKSRIMTIKKEEVINLLACNNVTKDNIQNLIEEGRKKTSPSERNYVIGNGVKLNFNFELKERPINLVIDRKILEKYAKYYKTIE